jgi:hypothetical protein
VNETKQEDDRTRMMALQLDRMPSERLQGHLATAEKFLEQLW